MIVLIVEDTVAQAESLELLLNIEKYVSYVAYSVDGAKALAELHPPDVVILDWIIPGGGLQFLCWLRQRKESAQIPVIVCTGLSSDDTGLRLDSPNVTILEKPVKPALLLSIVAQYNVREIN